MEREGLYFFSFSLLFFLQESFDRIGGNVVLIPFPFTDLSGEKIRPASPLQLKKKLDLKQNLGFESINLIQSHKKALSLLGVIPNNLIKNIDKSLTKLFEI